MIATSRVLSMAKERSQGGEPWEWFGARLRELREAAGLSRPQLAERAGMRSEAGIRNIEQGLTSPTWETVCRLCSALGVECTAFMTPPAETTTKPGPGRPSRKVQPADQGEAEPPAAEPPPPEQP